MNNAKRIAGGAVLAGAGAAGISRILRRRLNGAAGGRPPKSSAGHIDQTAVVLSREQPGSRAQTGMLLNDRLLYIRGWVAGGSNCTFGVSIDGGPPVPLEGRLDRPDVCAAVPGAGPDAGFELFVEMSKLEDAVHIVELHSVEGRRTTTLDRVTIRAAELRSHTSLQALQARIGGHLEIDGIRAGTRDSDRKARAFVVHRHEIVTVQGWAINELDRSPAARAYLLVDESDLWPVQYGMARDDVAQALNSPCLRDCGFQAVIDPSPYAAGEHTVMMVLGMNDGSIYACADSLVLWVRTD